MKRESTEHRIQFLENRMKNFIKIFNEMPAKDYPWSAMILDFGFAHIINQQEMAGRIKELAEILGKGIEISVKFNEDETMYPYIEVRK